MFEIKLSLGYFDAMQFDQIFCHSNLHKFNLFNWKGTLFLSLNINN